MPERKRVRMYSYRHDAELAKTLLEAAGIYAFITADDAGGQAVGIQFSGGVSLWVPASDYERARALLSKADDPASGMDDIDMSDLTIRALEPDDAEGAFRLRADATIRVLADELDRDGVAAMVGAYMPSDFAEMAETMPSFAAVLGDKLIGFCILRLLDPRTAEIFLIYVHLGHLGLGVGGRLIRHAEKWLEENRSETAWLVVDTVTPDYNGGFYERLGFAPVGDHFCQYPDGAIPALRLSKPLQPLRP